VRNRTPDDPEAVSLFIGARDPLVLAYLDDLVDESWEYYSRRDRD